MIFDGFVPVEGSPLYRQIIRHIQRGLAAGTIRFGDELPSRRVLSALLGVNPNTVQKAFHLLEKEGIIESRAGAKSVIAADEAAANRLRAELREVQARSVIRLLRESGLTKEEALALIEQFWDQPPERSDG